MEQIPASIWTLTAGVVVTLISFWVGHHHGLLPEQASEQAPLVDNFFDIMLTIGTALFLVVQGAIILFVIRYRRRAGEEGDGLPVEGNLPLEAFWTAIPALIVIFLGIYSVDIFQRMGGLNPGIILCTRCIRPSQQWRLLPKPPQKPPAMQLPF